MQLGAIDRMCGGLIDNWWMFLVRGILAIVFGVLALFEPLAALFAIVILFGAWALVDGISALWLSFAGRRSWQLVIVGILGLVVGVITFVRPGITAIGLYAAVAGWSIARGVLEIALAIEWRKVIRGELWLILGGIASILFGVLLIVLPAAGLLTLGWLIGIYALTFGIIMCALALRLHRLKSARSTTPPIVTPTPLPTV